MDALHAALADVPGGATLTVLTHSLGAINWMHHAAMSQDSGLSAPARRPTACCWWPRRM